MKYLFIIMCLFTTAAQATERYRPVVNNYSTTEVTNVYNTVSEDQIAAAVALSQQHADWATSDWQVFMGVGRAGNGSAIAVGLAKKLCGAGGDCPLLSVGYSDAGRDGDTFGLGINIRLH